MVENTRLNEWFVPKWGSQRFRALIGMTFWPYSAQNISYTVIGSMLAPTIHWEGVGVIMLVYLFGLGISAHALDARGSKTKPWGQVLSSNQLLALALAFFVLAVSIGVYYVLVNRLVLIWPVGLAEIFFLFAYNMELWGGKFHTDKWFAFSWGSLPILAGYFMQTDTLSLALFVMGVIGFTTAYVEISASRPYRAFKKARATDPLPNIKSVMDGVTDFSTEYFERILKSIVASVTLLAVVLMVMRA